MECKNALLLLQDPATGLHIRVNMLIFNREELLASLVDDHDFSFPAIFHIWKPSP